ncbi:hypothetical protein Tco_0322528 [Tanacetum coccineum]
MNIDNNGECASNTPIGAKIDKIERKIGEGKLRLLDNDGNPLVPTGIMESDSELELVFDETTNLRIPTSGKDGSDKGYGTNSLLVQWRDSYLDNDDYDLYDDDMYENHDLYDHLQSICDDLDITVLLDSGSGILSCLSSASAVTYISATSLFIGSITDIKSALTERALQIFCQTYHIPDEVHPQLPNLDQTIHEMPTGKIGVYTRFFEYANFRLPLSTFFVDVLRYYRIHISQLSVIGAAKVSHFEVLCRVHGFEPTVGLFRCLYVNSKNKGWMSFSKRPGNDVVCYTKPLDSLKNWNDRFFLVDVFACPASFPWNTSKSVPKDPFPKSSEFNVEHYATLVSHPSPFHKYPEPFLCLVGISRYYTLDENTYPQFLRDDDEEMDLLSFIRTVDPTKVRIGERQRGEDEPKLLDTTVGRTVPLLPVAPARAESELDASVDRLFDEGGSGTQAGQGDSAGGGGDEQDIVIQPVITVVTTAVEDVIPLQPRRLKKRKTTVSGAGGSSHPPKKLREDYETLSGASVGGKSKSVVQQLLAGAVQNVVVRGEPIPTLPFVTSSVSATPEREEEDHTDSLAGANLRTIGAPQRFVISSDSSHHSGANIAEAEADSFIRPSVPLMTMTTTVTSAVDPTTTAKDKLVESSIFGDGSSSGADHTVGGFSGLTGSDFIVGGIRI